MLTSPSFQENPAPLIDMLRAYACLDGASPIDALREQEARSCRRNGARARRARRPVVWRGLPG